MINFSTKLFGIIHYIQDQMCFASRGNRIYSSYDGGNSWEHLFSIPLPLSQHIQSLFYLTQRFFRMGVHHLTCIQDHTLVLLAYGKIYIYNLKKRLLNPECALIVGSRPLSLCKTNTHQLYYGEYRGNLERTPIHIFKSLDGGRQWQPVCQFTNVRHVHGIFHDLYDNKIWVTTGDNDEESGVWMTCDGFCTIEKVVGGNQQTRAVQLLFSKTHVYFGSDTPLEKNYIYRIEKKTGKLEKLQGVESSVFWGCKVGEYLFFSTAVEPSNVNKCRDACIWGSKDGEQWKCVARFRKDFWPKKLFQYGQILFPSGENNTDYLWFTPFATEKHLTVQRLSVKEIL